jgi:hypothetical protein
MMIIFAYLPYGLAEGISLSGRGSQDCCLVKEGLLPETAPASLIRKPEVQRDYVPCPGSQLKLAE